LWGHALGEEEQSKHLSPDQLLGFLRSKEIIDKTYKFFELYYGWGDALAEHKDYEKALEKYEEAININPRYAELYIKQGDAFKGNKEDRKAVFSYRKAIPSYCES
jgi:tetratricopeptide (TPR) repeat protein